MSPSALSVVMTHDVADSGCNPVRVTASDNKQYWVKVRNSPHGVEAILAEYVVHKLGRIIEAPVVPCELIRIPDVFAGAREPLEPGIGHASLDIRNQDELTEMLRVDRDHNSSRQARLIGLWDLCLGSDPQWLFNYDDDFSMFSHDHGGWFLIFEGAEWTAELLIDAADIPWPFDHPSPEKLDRPSLEDTAQAIETLTDAEIDAVFDAVPAEWDVPLRYSELMSACVKSRRTGVADRLRSLVKD